MTLEWGTGLWERRLRGDVVLYVRLRPVVVASMASLKLLKPQHAQRFGLPPITL